MENSLSKIPRTFSVSKITISDYGKVKLMPWEMVSLQTAQGKECDITATSWGFYLGGSANGRMKDQGFRIAIVRNSLGKLFVNAVEVDKLSMFQEYLLTQASQVVEWLE